MSYPKLLQVDLGRVFMRSLSQLMSKDNVKIRRGRKEIHGDQGIVERFNRTLAEKLFSNQYEKKNQIQKRNRKWVKRLPDVIKALNKETKKKSPPPITTTKKKIQICLSETVRYLYQPGEQGGGKRRATDQIWSVDMHKIDYHIITQGIIVYYLKNTSSKERFCERRITVPNDTYMHKL